MKKICIDSNVWLRFLLEDTKQARICKKLFEYIESGKYRAYTSSIVMLEIHYVLHAIYNLKTTDIINDLEAILSTRSLTLLEKTDFTKALAWHKKHKIKLADCLIGSQIPSGMILISFDKDFNKLPVKNMTPEEFLKQNA